MTGSSLIVEPGAVARIRFNRPEKHNAIDTPSGNHLLEALTELGHDPGVGAIVISGEGESFCSGDDRTERDAYHELDQDPQTLYDRLPYLRFISLVRRVPKPVITQVHGYCLAAGLDLVLASDYSVASRDARLGMLFGKLAVMAGTVLLPRHVGIKRASRLLLDGDIISADLALEWGLVTHVVERGDLQAAVDGLAERVARVALANFAYFGLMKASLNRVYFPELEEDVRHLAVLMKLRDAYKIASRDGGGR